MQNVPFFSLPTFRPFTREELAVIEHRIAEKRIKAEKKAERNARNKAVKYFHFLLLFVLQLFECNRSDTFWLGFRTLPNHSDFKCLWLRLCITCKQIEKFDDSTVILVIIFSNCDKRPNFKSGHEKCGLKYAEINVQECLS